ncbi:centrosomal protein of 19 kDa [Polypterus senegalus]|uniref:centrosomal protein of 19 kDa n=1 Tax=Polypterus senegalus TaxID=55291 RepID=UPI0019661953|nr:centrosomal protein of 19 kDa [Polypterus senegalus]XP_039618088.1 centrosomal protein of 19 kDa [Polypterus senegalus]XP_039618094.1 centrosomal protein of 19 kDa [Polypterus senegalus]
MSVVAKKCGVKFSPPAIVLIYEDKVKNQTRKRVMPVRNFFRFSDCSEAAEHLKKNPRHRTYLQGVPLEQLEKLYHILRDHLLGKCLEQSLAAVTLDPEEDLNKLDEHELTKKKQLMDQLFQKNQKKKGDPDFVYDLQVDFPEQDRIESCSWDDDDQSEKF